MGGTGAAAGRPPFHTVRAKVAAILSRAGGQKRVGEVEHPRFWPATAQALPAWRECVTLFWGPSSAGYS